MTSIVRSLCLRQIGAILVLPMALAIVGLGCSKATDQQPVASETESNSSVLAISTEPVDVTVEAPAPATFSVAATGTNLTYQWQRDGQNIEGATSETYTLDPTAATDNNAVFKVIITDGSAQTVTSAEVKLTVMDATSTAKPVINSFAADNATISAGASATLTWDVTNATSLSIDKLGAMTGNSVTVTPSASTTYVLTATNSNGTTTASATVTVGGSTTPDAGAPVITSFVPSSNSISKGSSVKLLWTVSNATSLAIEGIGAVYGDYIAVSPAATTTFTLTATNANGSVSTTTTVNVASAELPVIDSFAASAPVIPMQGTSMLAWKVKNATSITIDNSVGTVTDKNFISVKPVATTTYTLTATNEAGSVTSTVTVSINEGKGKKYKKHCHHYKYYHRYYYPWGVYFGW